MYDLIGYGKTKEEKAVEEKAVEEKEWKCEKEPVYTECPYTSVNIIVRYEVFSKIKYMCGKFTEKEFFVYAIGKKNATSTKYIVEDILIPKQEVAYAGVDKIVPISRPDIIGTIHKHPGESKPQFSSVDDEYMNYGMMIVVNSKGTLWNSMVKMKTKCGCIMIAEPALNIVQDNIDRKELKKQMKNIKEKTYATYNQGTFYDSNSDCPFKNKYNVCTFGDFQRCNYHNYDCPYRTATKEDKEKSGVTNAGNGYPETWD
jgi:hypothetical protein